MLDWERAEATLTNTDASLAPPTQTASATVDAESVRTASFVFSPLKPTSGYSLTIKLWKKNPQGTDEILAQGTSSGITLASGPNAVTVPLTLTAQGQLVVGTAQPALPYAFLGAVNPSLASAGATLTLDGVNFGGSATVNFPGGVSQAATVLSSSRLSVTVPAGATTGDLTVSTQNVVTNPLPFGRPNFGLGLQNFQLRYEQADYARQSPALNVAREGPTCVSTGRYVYVAGGRGTGAAVLTSVERAAINADGTLGPFMSVAGVSLRTPRYYATSTVIGRYCYVIGGWDGTSLGTVERALINADGTLGDFATVPGITLQTPRYHASSTIIGPYLYVVGGAGGGSRLGSVERAPISPDGSLGAFQAVATLQAAREGTSVSVIGNYLYVLGGYNGAAMASVERAPIGASGDIGAFATVAGVTLEGTGRYSHTSAIVGDKLFLFGGGASLTTVEQASIDPATGNLGTFAAVAGVALKTGRARHGMVQVGGYLHIIGGLGTSPVYLSSVERVSLNASGNVSAFSASTSTLVTARDLYNGVVIGNWLYVLGGWNGTDLNSVERAPINRDGTLGPFTTAGQPTLGTARRTFASAVVGNRLFVLGGYNGTNQTSVECAPIDADGNLGAFVPATTNTGTAITLTGARNSSASVVIGDWLYLIGGSSNNTLERAAIQADGTLGTFSATGLPTMTTGREGAAVLVAGGYLYVIGGFGTGGVNLASIERAPIDASGNLGTFTTTGLPTLITARHTGGCVVVGNQLYLIGGWNGTYATGTPIANVEKATIASDGSLGTFSASTSLPAARGCHVTAMSGSRVYLVGGYGGGYLNSVLEGALQ